MGESLAGSLKITIITPAHRGSKSGNRVTGLRWAGLLRQLGHRVSIATQWRDHDTDVLITVHALKSAEAVIRASEQRPDIRIVTLLAGTDIYPNFAPPQTAQAALRRADALIALQPRALEVLPEELRAKARTVVQSATALSAPRPAQFSAIVLAHLRPVKQPLLALSAVEQVPAEVPIQLTLAGAQIDSEYSQEVMAAVAQSSRANWVGPLTRRASKLMLSSSHVCIVPSSAEGGANVVSEAIAAGTPILCSAIPGNTGLLGDDWPGMFAAGDDRGLAKLLTKAASDRAFFDELCLQTRALQPMVAPATERAAWREILAQYE
mgnify:CR=1 FL=1